MYIYANFYAQMYLKVVEKYFFCEEKRRNVLKMYRNVLKMYKNILEKYNPNAENFEKYMKSS